MPVQRTISPANYLTPTDKEIVDAINQTLGPDPYGRSSNKGVDLQNVPNALIRDIANLAAGGSIVEPSDSNRECLRRCQETQVRITTDSVEHADGQCELRLYQQERRIHAEDNG